MLGNKFKCLQHCLAVRNSGYFWLTQSFLVCICQSKKEKNTQQNYIEVYVPITRRRLVL